MKSRYIGLVVAVLMLCWWGAGRAAPGAVDVQIVVSGAINGELEPCG